MHIHTKRFISTSFEELLRGMKRYKWLTDADKRKLLNQHNLKAIDPLKLSQIEEKLGLKPESYKQSNAPLLHESSTLPDPIKNELSRLRSRQRTTGRLWKQRNIIGVGKSKYFMGIDPNSELEQFETISSLFCDVKETETLVEDIKKATHYENIKQVLGSIRPVDQDEITDRFMDILARAIEKNISGLEFVEIFNLINNRRPILMNELADYESAYAMKRATLKNLIINKCTRNAFDESRIDKFLDRLGFLARQKFNAPLPPEVLEPLMAFKGIVKYSFCPVERLKQKIASIKAFITSVANGNPNILESLPEFQDPIGTNYPFANYYGFKSCVPNDVTGSILMGRTCNAKMDDVRYPNLQSVAHSLPKDRKYRAIVIHAIRVLERSRGWDHQSKIKVINRLVDVYNNLAPSSYYSRVLDRALPLEHHKRRLVYTKSRQQVFNQGLVYIGSLTKNHWTRATKAKGKGGKATVKNA
ncbi:hypothetical protein BdWA1_000625 [Babesia duncani]|uniref:Uncharacterized protein n=1 Tax=Babesia duncani TaxID=323732 RepID=A0AAD9PNJ5_9APIC|nr:hypothetical protein BdWA1_003951 [Babesia duncani]KAK2197623.1 hypothetical protein BdWA1_000625 [Babesia duncani]